MIVTTLPMQIFAARIDSIKIKGNQRIEQSTILEYLGINVGEEYSELTTSDAVKNLYATSLFENINIKYDNGVLNVQVVETPFVSKVVFSGNNKVKTNTLTTELHTAAGESLKKAKLRADVEKIKEIYKRAGRYSVHVKSKIEPQENNRVKVVFEIDEGPKTGIKAIYFVGNENYKNSELKSLILTKEARWFRFLESNDTYDPERIEYDKHLIKQFYNSVGFADFRIISVTADLLPTKEGFTLTYSMEEGAKYKFGRTMLRNKLKDIDDDEIRKYIRSNEGQTFNLTLIQNSAENISNYLGSKGYTQVDVRPEVKPNPATGLVDVIMVVDQAEKVFINRIVINGNVKTEDHVIRRQLKIAEGDVYNRRKIERGERNIRNLDYFAKMSLGPVATKKSDRYDIKIDVEEKSTSSIGLDVGYNTAGGPFGRISFIERNLVGTGRILNAGIQVGKKNLHYYAGLTDPNFMDKDFSLGGNVFRTENGSGSGFTNQELNYAMKSMGAKVSVGYDISEDLSHEIDYQIKRDELKSSGQTASGKSTSIFIKEQMGTFLTSSISHTLTYDKTDSRIVPKNGYLISGTQEYAGLGGDAKYLKHEIDAKAFKSFFENKYTLKLSGSAGNIKGVGGKKVRISDRFNLGEPTMRGFAQSGIGPRVKGSDEGLGGQNFYVVTTELNFPVGLPEEFNVTGAVFCDAGSLWEVDTKTDQTERGFHNDKSLRASVGFGVLWVTKIAPIRLDWGFPIKKKKHDEGQTFHIKFSTNL